MKETADSVGDDLIDPKLVCLSVCTAIVYGSISLLSWRFDFESPPGERPIVIVLLLFAFAFGMYLVAIRRALILSPHRTLLRFIFLSAFLFRLILLFSLPIQEVDIYRYLWDGSVSCAGVSPFNFSPNQIMEYDSGNSKDLNTSSEDKASRDQDLATLASLRDSSPVDGEILSRVHFPELPTVYPSVSQLVFAGVTCLAPADAQLLTRLILMKACFVAFDLATLALVMLLLKRCSMHLGLSLIYAWCPLLMKEVANSGHLDAIAVFLTAAAVCVILAQRLTSTSATLASLTLALAVGAKLYPIVLVPLFAVKFLRQLGWLRALPPVIIFSVTTAACLLPWTSTPIGNKSSNVGVLTFLRQWEINDFLFLNVIENVKPNTLRDNDGAPWFSIVPEATKQKAIESIASFGIAPSRAPFFLARLLTALVFSGIALTLAWKTNLSNDSAKESHLFCESVFLTLAWFWLLCPTQNPWYWTWTLPFLAFTRNRIWLLASGLVFLYYLRFWFGYQFANSGVLGTPYEGTRFFDYCVTWVEFGPWLTLLFASWLFARNRDGKQERPSPDPVQAQKARVSRPFETP